MNRNDGHPLAQFERSGRRPQWTSPEPSWRLDEVEYEKCEELVNSNEFIWGYYHRAVESAQLALPHARTYLVTEVPQKDEPSLPDGSSLD